MTNKLLWTISGCLILTALAAAQPTAPQTYLTRPVATGIGASGDSMAVNAWGTTYVLNLSPAGVSDSITAVSRAGVVDSAYATGLGRASQIAFNPQDGHCYVAFHSPVLPVVLSRIYKLDSSGPVQVGSTPLIAEGFAIDDDGRWIFGTNVSVGGPGIYKQLPGSSLMFFGLGFGSNSTIMSMAGNDDVLIADGLEVRRQIPAALVAIPYWSTPFIPNNVTRVKSVARSPFDQVGQGAMVGVNTFTTLCNCGFGNAYPGSATAGSSTPLATEAFTGFGAGMVAIAPGPDDNLYWLTRDSAPGTGISKTLYRIEEQTGAGIPGSLKVTVLASPVGSVVDVQIWGEGGAPVLFGALAAPMTTPSFEIYTPYGWIMNLFHPNYIPVLDGVGMFGPANPLAVLPANGNGQWTFPVPALGISLGAQALISDTKAPNGSFNITNIELRYLP